MIADVPAITLTWTPAGANGVIAVTAKFPDGKSSTHRLNVLDVDARAELGESLCTDRPGIDPEDVAGQLEGIAAEMVGQPQGQGTGGRASQADLLVRLVESEPGLELFHSPDGDAYAWVTVNGHRETRKVTTKDFREWLSHRFYKDTGKSPSSQALQTAIGTVCGKAKFASPQQPIFLRIAPHGHDIWLDLCDADWSAVQITRHGWKIVPSEQVPVRFIRRQGMQALPQPVPVGSVEELRALLNFEDEEHWSLTCGWLVGAFNPHGPYGVLNINGEKGSGKSTACRLCRRMIDPNKADLRRPPKDERDVFIAAGNGWVCCYNNLSGLRRDISDALCALSTDGGFATRALYENDDETIFDQRRPVILNGIEELAERSDLVDRMVSFTLPPIPPHKRREEREVLADYERARPRVLGAILTAVSAALRNLSATTLSEKPRMADLAMWVTAAEEGLGWVPGRFARAMLKNQRDSVVASVEASAIGPYVLRLIERGALVGTATDLLERLNAERGDLAPPPDWPRQGKGLGAALRRIAPDLRSMGITVLIPKQGTGRDKQRVIRIEREGQERSARSASSAMAVPGAEQGAPADCADDADGSCPTQSVRGDDGEEFV